MYYFLQKAILYKIGLVINRVLLMYTLTKYIGFIAAIKYKTAQYIGLL